MKYLCTPFRDAFRAQDNNIARRRNPLRFERVEILTAAAANGVAAEKAVQVDGHV
jgi:hypothetical protein